MAATALAQEQMHAGLLRSDRSHAEAFAEAGAVAEMIRNIDWPATTKGDVALIFDYESAWAWRIQHKANISTISALFLVSIGGCAGSACLWTCCHQPWRQRGWMIMHLSCAGIVHLRCGVVGGVGKDEKPGHSWTTHRIQDQ